MKKLVIILPTYNERKNITSLIEEIEKIFDKQLGRYDTAILVVDDKSPDETAKEVKKLIPKYNNITLISGEKTGLGAAYIRGMRYAIAKMGAEVVFEMDADFSHDPNLLPKFVLELEKGADIVIGSRYIKGGSIPKQWHFERKVFSIFGNLIVRLGLMILKIHDWTSGYRAIKGIVVETIEGNLDRYTGYTFQVAFLHRAIQKGFKVSEIPLNFIDRKYGKSKFIPSDYVINALLYILLNSSFIKYLIVGTVGFIVQTVMAKILIGFKLHPGISVSFGAEGAIISNFIFNQFWTFSHKKIVGRRKILAKFLQFNFACLGAVLIQGIAVTVGTGIFGNDHWFIFMVISVIFLVIPYSYFIYHNFIWKEKK